jgi:hypothetical protein
MHFYEGAYLHLLWGPDWEPNTVRWWRAISAYFLFFGAKKHLTPLFLKLHAIINYISIFKESVPHRLPPLRGKSIDYDVVIA